MKNSLFRLLCPLLACVSYAGAYGAPQVPEACRQEIARMLTRVTAREVAGGWVRIDRMQASRSRVRIHASIGLSYYPFREQSVEAIYDSVRQLLPPEFRRARIELYTDRRRIEELIPVACRSAAARRKMRPFTNRSLRSDRPLVTRLSAAWTPPAGLRGRHIALWQSHGRYFDQRRNCWRWQRARLWETCEDLYTQGYVLPFLVPMLENAGANVLLPRERDVRRAELVADNDPGIGGAVHYAETAGRFAWSDGGPGFAHLRSLYRAGENPFREGTVRRTTSVTEAAECSTAEWSADIPEAGEYAVYVSYRSLPESAEDARYTVRHLGGESRFAVNQTMGGGTWIYLGTFPFAAGRDAARVVLSNLSSQAGRVVTADAVKIGGGMGNVARTVCDSLRRADGCYAEEPSGYPRFCEGARYWLQWAGFGEEVHSPRCGTDDYKDDYMSRALWVNALAGGSERLPEAPGLGIPVDMALAFHSDAGVRDGDETIGTLGIFYTRENGGRFEGGADRYLSRDLTDLVMTQIVHDVRRTFEPEWRRRGLWNRSYYEARVPGVPTMLLELLSHQNFADMRYGSDPRFRFVVSRAVYKGILRYLGDQYGVPYVVQPLPVADFSACLFGEDSVRLAWRPEADTLEPTARPKGYVVYVRTDDGGFDDGRLVGGTSCTLPVEPGRRYDFRVTAVNDGGESFPGETLSVCRMPEARGCVLVVNAFDRVSAPPVVRTDSLAGFRRDDDDGVAWGTDITFAGAQRVFDPAAAHEADERCALGACGDDYAAETFCGNTFDYPSLHGRAIAAAGWSYCSASAGALVRGDVAAEEYDAIDLVLGKQRTVTVGRGTRGAEFRTFPPVLRAALRRFTQAGGALFVSGCYPLTDMLCGPEADGEARAFAAEVLHCAGGDRRRAGRGRVTAAVSPAAFRGGAYRFRTERSDEGYAVEASDVLRPAAGACAVLRYDGGPDAAGVAWEGAGAGRTVVLGFPFETVTDPVRREALMGDVLGFLGPCRTCE